MVVEMTALVSCDAGRLWQAWRPAFSMRPREDESRNLDLYPLAFGLRIPVTLTALNEMKSWTVEHRLPAGRLTIDHWMKAESGGGVRIGKRFEVRGPMILPYGAFILPAVRRDWPRQVRELTRRAER